MQRLKKERATLYRRPYENPKAGAFSWAALVSDSWYFYPYNRVVGRLARRPKPFYYWAPCKAPRNSVVGVEIPAVRIIHGAPSAATVAGEAPPSLVAAARHPDEPRPAIQINGARRE